MKIDKFNRTTPKALMPIFNESVFCLPCILMERQNDEEEVKSNVQVRKSC